MKPFKTLDEQIELLQNRGLIIQDIEKAKQILLFNNYYNLINQFTPIFTIAGSDSYLPGTTFEEIVKVFLFDKDIKSAFRKALLDAESTFKSVLSYYFSLNHQGTYPYFEVENFNQNNPKSVMKVVAAAAKKIDYASKTRSSNAIKHHYFNHEDVPLWVLSNELTFGDIINFYEAMTQSEQMEIAKIFQQRLNENLGAQNAKFFPNNLIGHLEHIHCLRNVVAHSNKLLEFKCRNNLPHCRELFSAFSIQQGDSTQDVYYVYLALIPFLTKEEFNKLTHSLSRKMKKLDCNLKTVTVNDIIGLLGFPADWHLSVQDL